MDAKTEVCRREDSDKLLMVARLHQFIAPVLWYHLPDTSRITRQELLYLLGKGVIIVLTFQSQVWHSLDFGAMRTYRTVSTLAMSEEALIEANRPAMQVSHMNRQHPVLQFRHAVADNSQSRP